MNERLKSLGSSLLGITFLVAFLALAGGIIWGGGWLSSRILPILNVISFFLVPVALVIFVPLGFIRSTRSFAGQCLYLSSYIFGLTLWMTGLVATLQLWGLAATIIGVCLAGIGVVLTAFLASLFKGEWIILANLFLLTFLTFGTRSLGLQRVVKAAMERTPTTSVLDQAS
jgi:hypothetical protein